MHALLNAWTLHTLSCMDFESNDCKVMLKPRKVPYGHGQRVCLSRTSTQQKDGLRKTLLPGSITWTFLR